MRVASRGPRDSRRPVEGGWAANISGTEWQAGNISPVNGLPRVDSVYDRLTDQTHFYGIYSQRHELNVY